MPTPCELFADDLAAIADGDPEAIARHTDHVISCDDCRDARHAAERTGARVALAGADYAPMGDLAERLLARIPEVVAPPAGVSVAETATPTGVVGRATLPGIVAPIAPVVAAGSSADLAPNDIAAATSARATSSTPPAQTTSSKAAPKRRRWLAVGAIASASLAAAAGIGVAMFHKTDDGAKTVAASDGSLGRVASLERAAKDSTGGLTVRTPTERAWRPLAQGAAIPAFAELATDERTRVALQLADGTRLVLDHKTTVALDFAKDRRVHVAGGRLVADVAHVEDRPASFTTPGAAVDVVGTRFSLTATDTLTDVQVVRGAIVLRDAKTGAHDDVRAGEEGTLERGQLSVAAAPQLAKEIAWSELDAPTAAASDDVTAGLGALRAYKPGESRDRDWNLALAKHDVKVRIVGPIARTEITETFRNDSDQTLEGAYQFPLPADAQIDGLALDVKDAPNGFIEGAFVDKQRAQKIWRGVIDKATPHPMKIASSEIIWVPGRWRDPALLDWQRGGRFELRVYPIPAHGSRTIKLAYTQVVAPRGGQREYVYPLAHSRDGSTVADELTVDVEVRGAARGGVRAAGYDLAADPARAGVNALMLRQTAFVPRGDLVIDYRTESDAELRAWSFAGGTAIAPDEKLAAKQGVGNDKAVTDAQRAVAADARPTAVIALQPKLPRWRETVARDYAIVVDASQSMVGERFTRATQLATQLAEQLDRRDRFTVLACDSECRRWGSLRAPTGSATADMAQWLAAQEPAGASDLVSTIRSAAAEFAGGDATRERWVIFVGDGFASTGFRRAADVERALADTTRDVHVTTVGIGADADSTMLAAAARGGGGSFLAWLPGERVKNVAAAALDTTYGATLRDATVELPAGLADASPAALPTIRAGEEVLVAARIVGDVRGDVVLRGTLAGQPFEQKYPLALAVSSAAGNAFVPRLWASLAIGELERAGTGEDRAKIVALSQGYGVMSRETSLLVLESQAMFDAFGVDRHAPQQTFTGEEQLDEVAAGGLVALDNADPDAAKIGKGDAAGGEKRKDIAAAADEASTGTGFGVGNGRSSGHALAKTATAAPAPATATMPSAPRPDTRRMIAPGKKAPWPVDGRGRPMVRMLRTWERVAAVANYDGVNPAITRAVDATEAALAAAPDSREKHRAAVQALSYAGELDRATQIAARWLERDRLDPQALGYLADLAGRDGQRDRALRTLAGLVDLSPDQLALHERLVRAYDATGRAAQACGHRIALAALQPKITAAAGAAMRCLRATGRAGDADLVRRALPDDAARASAEKAATVATLPARFGGDLVVAAKWDGGADLDLSLITPEGSRVSWMGGRTDATVTDATSTAKEQLSVATLKRGNYLLEVSRASAGTGPVRGTLDITVLGERQHLTFELTGSHATVARVSVSLVPHDEPIDDPMMWEN